MSFDTPAGTRGARQPSGPFLPVDEHGHVASASPQGRQDDGLQRPGPDDRRRQERGQADQPGRLVSRSRRQLADRRVSGRGARNPAWYYNIAAHPDEVQIEVDGRTIPVTAKQLHGPERDEAWQQITTAAPRFAQYEQKTDRVMPVIRLVPR
jgi:deazaflavin-dependent oxidoreductase (nitroreductase family)